MKHQLYFIACVLGVVLCLLRVLPIGSWMAVHIPNDYFLIGLCALFLYLAGYCFYLIGVAINDYLTYSDFQ